MANEVGREYRLEVQSTIDAVKTVTAITKASPAVVSCASHGYAPSCGSCGGGCG